MKQKIKVLLTNDDGFHAKGLQTLANFLAEVAEVFIAAPDRERSAVGHGITMHQPLRAFSVGENHWMINGTPSDCVKLALDYLLKENRPAIVISGINRGPNLGSDVLYSGTVSAAIEGSFYDIPSIATSLAGFGKLDFEPAAEFITAKLNLLINLAEKSTLNINFPTNPFQGVRFTRLGQRSYENPFVERVDPRGQQYFWLAGDPIPFNQDPNSDIKAVEDNYISITPLHSDLTDFQKLNRLEQQSNLF